MIQCLAMNASKRPGFLCLAICGLCLIYAMPARPFLSSQNLAHHMSFDIGQAKIAAGVTISQAFVVEAQEVQDGGVQVVDVNTLFDGAVAELVGGAVDVAPLDAAAGEGDGEA